MRDFLNFKGQDKGSEQACGLNDDASKKNHFYSLHSRGEQETSPYFLTGMFKVCSINVYTLLDPAAIFSFLLLY